MNNCVPFQQAEISDCKKVNFIFGANGSGKSTISSFLAMYPNTNTRFETSSIIWEDTNHETIEVYNRDFRYQNLQQENIPGIFTLGSDSIKDINEIKRLRNELDNKEKALNPLRINLDECKKEEKPKCEAKFKEDVWNRILKKNEKDFLKAFEGLRNNKERFLEAVKKRKEGLLGHQGTICDRDDLLKRSQALYASNPEKSKEFNIANIQYLLSELNQIRNDSIWGTVIAGNTDVNISGLIKALDNSSWVSQGRQYLRDSSKICPFCQQETITNEFRQQLESFFDKDYERKLIHLKEQHNNYNDIANQIIKSLNDISRDNDASVSIGQLNVELLTTRKDLLKSKIEKNITLIEDKISEPGKRVSIVDVSDLIEEILNQLNLANENIRNHNELVDNHVLEAEKLTDDIWATCLYQEDDLIRKYLEDMNGFEKKIKSISEKIEKGEQEIKQIRQEIIEKEKNTTSIQPSVDKINSYLRMYGFTNFSIQPVDNGKNYYCIKRDDGTEVENTLSEGEETFLTFLYFMQKVDGAIDQNHVSDKRIIVLDDPICSLDSTVLYIVSSMVRNLIKRIRDNQCRVTQLFVLTHNVFFHKEASYPLDRRNKKPTYVNYWFIRKHDNKALINPCGIDNPISSSYELLWKELKETKETSFISIQNIMRRIIEFYFSTLGGIEMDDITEKIESAKDQMFIASLFLWMNGGSHTIPDDLFYEPDTDSLQHYKDIFRLVFKESGHIAHYNMMMGIQDEADNSKQVQ